jgi:hypothetical protein
MLIVEPDAELNAGDEAAVYANGGTVDVGSAFAGEKRHYIAILFRLPITA